jgi:hypothetical protein
MRTTYLRITLVALSLMVTAVAVPSIVGLASAGDDQALTAVAASATARFHDLAGIAFAAPAPVATTYSRAATEICAHALLFDGRHAIGTRAGAVAVAQDIRSSTRRRLARLAALQTPHAQRTLVALWLVLEQRLADVYASSYLRIYDVIAAARTPKQRARAPRILERLVHAPDPLRQAAARLEQRLQVPDCTGG